MKTVKLLSALLIFCISSVFVQAQSPCSGTPGANTITPLSQTICAGSALNLNLANSYTNSGITFQWQTSTVSIVGPFTTIPGATLHTLATPGLTTTTFYNVVITCTNSGLSISVPYSVTIIPCNVPCTGTPALGSILPANSTVCIGTGTLLSLSNTYTQTGITYQWYSASAATGPFTAAPGATLSTYNTPTLSGTTYYQVVVSCTNSTASYTAAQTVSAVPCNYCSGAPAANSIAPANATVCAGGNATLSLANAYPLSGYIYQWQQSTVSQVGPFQNISGATNSVFVTPPINTTTYYNLIVTCTNSAQFISIPTSVSVVNCNVPCTGTPGANSIVPANLTVCAGSSTLLSLANTYSQTGITFQWGSATSAAGPYTPISGATQTAFTTPTLASNVFYNVVITCTNGGLSTTASRSIAVVPCTNCSGAPPANTVIPVNSTICIGSSTTLSLLNTYTAAGYTYQWQSSTVSPVGPFSSIAGANSSTLSTGNLSLTTFYQLIVTCTNGGSSISILQTVNVMTCAPVCSGQPIGTAILASSPTVCMGSAAQLSITSTYTNSGITMQWGVAGTAAGPYVAVPGATLASYTTPNLNSNAFYNVVITCVNSGQTVTATQSLAVINCSACQGVPFANTLTPVNSTICAGSTVNFSLVNTYTGSGITYQWQQSTVAASGPFVPIVGAAQATLALSNINTTTFIKLIVTCATGNTSLAILQTVYVQPCSTPCSGVPSNVSVLPLTHTICAGTAATMSVSPAYTVTGISYGWERASAAVGPFTLIPGATSTVYTSGSLQTTTFYNAVITCTNSGLSTRATHTVQVVNCSNPSGIVAEQLLALGIKVYPNPNKGLVTILCNVPAQKEIVITDVSGRILYRGSSAELSTQLDLQYLQSGLYHVEIEVNGLKYNTQFYKE